MSYHVNVSDHGTVEVPADLLREAGMRIGDRLVIEPDDEGRLVIRTYAQMVRDVQARFRGLVPAGRSLVDELIAERRADAAREDTEFQESHRSLGQG